MIQEAKIFWLNGELFKTLQQDGITDPSSRKAALEMYQRALSTDLLVIDDIVKQDEKTRDGKTVSWTTKKFYLIAEQRRTRSNHHYLRMGSS